jgi:hypothetical protein
MLYHSLSHFPEAKIITTQSKTIGLIGGIG